MIGPTCKHLQIARLNYIYGTDHHEADRAIAPAAASVGVASAAGGAAGAAAGAGGGGDGNTAAGSSSVRELNSGVGASDDVSGASGASGASGGGDVARGCLRGRCGAICGASLSSAVSRQTSGLGSRARVWIGFRASEASRGRLNASDGSNGDEGSPSPDEPSSSSLLPDGDASSSSRAAAAPSARFDMMMNGQLLRCPRGSLPAFAEPGLQVDRLPSQTHQRGCLGQHVTRKRDAERWQATHKKS